MPAAIQERIRENIEYMLWIGMTVGEIQVVYPSISNQPINRIAKEIGVTTSKHKKTERLASRNKKVIKNFLTKLLENEMLENPEKLQLFIEKIEEIDPTSRKHRMKKAFMERVRIENSNLEKTIEPVVPRKSITKQEEKEER